MNFNLWIIGTKLSVFCALLRYVLREFFPAEISTSLICNGAMSRKTPFSQGILYEVVLRTLKSELILHVVKIDNFIIFVNKHNDTHCMHLYILIKKARLISFYVVYLCEI